MVEQVIPDAGKVVEDMCVCGDWRSHHPNDGPCTFNGPGFDMCHGGQDCMSFRSARAASSDTAKSEGEV